MIWSKCVCNFFLMFQTFPITIVTLSCRQKKFISTKYLQFWFWLIKIPHTLSIMISKTAGNSSAFVLSYNVKEYTQDSLFDLLKQKKSLFLVVESLNSIQDYFYRSSNSCRQERFKQHVVKHTATIAFAQDTYDSRMYH